MTAELRHPCELLRHIRIMEKHHGHIRGLRRILGLAHAQLTKRALIVETRRIDEHDRPDAMELHGLVDGIRRRARHLGDRGH